MTHQVWSFTGGAEVSAPMSAKARRLLWENQIRDFKEHVDWAKEMRAGGRLTDDQIRFNLQNREKVVRERLRHVTVPELPSGSGE